MERLLDAAWSSRTDPTPGLEEPFEAVQARRWRAGSVRPVRKALVGLNHPGQLPMQVELVQLDASRFRSLDGARIYPLAAIVGFCGIELDLAYPALPPIGTWVRVRGGRMVIGGSLTSP